MDDHYLSTRRRNEKKTSSQSSAEAPSYTMGAVRLNIGPLPINNRNNLKGEINKQGKQHMTLRNKDKQTNGEAAHVEVWIQEAVQCHATSGVQYAMHQS